MEPRSLKTPGAHDNELHLLEWSREGVPMLLVHGFGNEAHIWDDFAPAVAPYYRVLALDLRGHGDSGWDAAHRYDYEHHVADLECVFAKLGIERAVLVGHSLGGRVCTLYAGAHPETVAGFVIVDSGPELDARGVVRIRMDVEENRDPSFTNVREYESALSLGYPAARPSAIARMAKHGLKERGDGRLVLKMDTGLRDWGESRPDAEAIAAREERIKRELWAALEKLQCPTLVVRGAASDILSADTADRMVDEVIPDARLAVVAQAGHSVMTDNPEGFRDAVCAFVLGED